MAQVECLKACDHWIMMATTMARISVVAVKLVTLIPYYERDLHIIERFDVLFTLKKKNFGPK